MAEVLLNSVVNDEIKLELFIKWLLRTGPQEQYLREFSDCNCSQTDFLTYFLNFIHEEVPCHSRYGDTPQKASAPKRTELVDNEETSVERRFIDDKKQPDTNSSAMNKSIERDRFFCNVSQCSTPNYSHVSSTPKVYAMQANSNLTNGHISPISPLYRAQNSFSTPKNRGHGNTSQKSLERAPSLRLADFIVNNKSSGKKKASRSLLIEQNSDESSKRIKPTCLSQVKVNGNFRQTGNSFNNFQSTQEVPVENVNDSRNFLAEERLKILSRKNSGDSLAVVSTKKMASVVNLRGGIEPDIESVTNKKHLECLIGIYVAVLGNNLVLNVNSEIYFLISLLVSRQMDFRDGASANSSDDFHLGVDFLDDNDRSDVMSDKKCKVHATDLFETIHNVCYFATKCLESQLDIVKHYDRSTLRLLSSNRRLKAFSEGFADRLSKISEKKPDRVLELHDLHVQTNVCFNLDTDNRGNFPSDSSFHTFRKQRDLFYEILRIWENNHSGPGWNFFASLGGKIRGLFGSQSESANFMHFSRLFKAQLLSTCGRIQKDEPLSENQLPFLDSLPNVDADKLKRLKSRLITKQTPSCINPLPTFPGHQEFYRDFIVAAGNHAFNKHLTDTLIAEIIDLNDNGFTCIDLEESGKNVDPPIKKAYVACLKSLRVLAKFLGFIEALPYKSDGCNYTEKFLTTQINVRQQTAPSFDVKALLLTSIEANNLILTLPWITEYVAMLDYVTLRLPYYISVHKILFGVYKNYGTKPNQGQYNYNLNAIRFCLGWLFELPHFPDSEYFNFCTNPNEKFPSHTSSNRKLQSKGKTVDGLNVIDQHILYVCCPYLDEIKKLLSSNASSGNATVKHITPVTALQSSDEMAKKRLEQQLEEAFFNGQPVSVRKTVEFVSERVASTCVKHICAVVVPAFKKFAVEEVRRFLNAWREANSVLSPVKEKSPKNALKTKVNQMAQQNLKSLKDDCEKQASKIAKDRIPSAIDSLLAIDVLPQTKDVCHSITTKLCLERVRLWINSQVTLSVFTKDFDSETHKVLSPENKIAKDKPAFALPAGGTDKKHNEGSLSAFHLLEKIKVVSVDVLENPAEITAEIVLNLLGESYETLNERCDVNDCIMTCTCSLLVDFALLLITHKPDVMTSVEVLHRFVAIWRCLGAKTKDLFKNLLCLRNAMLLAQSGNVAAAWEGFADFTAYLIKENVLACDAFESQCTGFFNRDWDQAVLENFSVFLRTFVERHKRYGGASDMFTFLLGFLSDYCSDL